MLCWTRSGPERAIPSGGNGAVFGALAMVCGAGLLVGGCSGSPQSSDAAASVEVAHTVHRLESSDRTAVAGVIAPDTLAELGGVDAVIPPGDRVVVDERHVDLGTNGHTATVPAVLIDAAGARTQVQLLVVRGRGSWRVVASLGSAPASSTSPSAP
jgi:hypothetical protein